MEEEKILFLDLDGVIVDFIRGVEDRYGVKYPYSKSGSELYEVMDRYCDEIFSHLPVLPGGELFLDLYTKNPGRVKFLTAVPAHWSVDMYFAGRDSKEAWLQQYLPDLDLVWDVYVVGDKDTKKFYAEPNHILVDDHDRTINDWIQAGGIGYHYPSGGLHKSFQYMLAEEVVDDLVSKYGFKN
jgi:hypothetical protein